MLLTLVLAAPAAYALARLRLRGGALVMLLLLISQLLPSIVIAGPLFVLFSRIDLVNSYQGLILADVSITLPFAVIILRPFFLTVPLELEAAALVDGSTRFGAFWRIVVATGPAGADHGRRLRFPPYLGRVRLRAVADHQRRRPADHRRAEHVHRPVRHPSGTC